MKNAPTVVLIVLAFWGMTTTGLNAWDNGMPWFGYGYSGSLYGLGHVPVPPYFALHPPVQYSRPIAYPYGHTPYAVRPHEVRVIVETPTPRLIVNPFAPGADRAAAIAAEQAKIIVNPYYQPTPETPAKEGEEEKTEAGKS